MITQNPIPPYDPARLVKMVVMRPMYFEQKRVDVGVLFECRADLVSFLEASNRCRIANDEDRSMVYRRWVAN